MRHWFCFLIASVLFATLAPGCRPKPPQVAVQGPDEVKAGSAVTLTAVAKPAEKGLAYTWKIEWIRDRAGNTSCRPTITDGAPSARITFPGDCEAGHFQASVRVAARGGKVGARKTIRVIELEKPVWPDPVPDGWKILNDYEKPGDPRANNWGGFFGTWGFHGGKCGIRYGEKSPGKLTISYAMHMDDSSCGTFEYLKGERGKSKPVDISGFDKITLLVKSGDDQIHQVRFEIVEMDPYAATLQGYVGESRLLTAGPRWKRYEVRLDKVLHPHFDRKMGKQVGLKLERKDLEQASGVVLLDNIAFIGKAEEKGTQ